MTDKQLLQNIYLFKTLNEEQLQSIADFSEPIQAESGKDVFKEGSDAKAMFVIKFGSIRIHQKSEVGDAMEVALLGSGSHFGEMPLLDQANRSATATVVENAELIRISYDGLNKLLQSDVLFAKLIYQAFAQFLCSRLRITTSDLSYCRESNLAHF